MKLSPASEPQRFLLDEDMTIYHAAEQKQQLLDVLYGGNGLELDLSRVGEIDTAGFQLLLLIKREARQQGKTLRIIAHSPAVREVVDFFNVAADFGDPMLIPAGETVNP